MLRESVGGYFHGGISMGEENCSCFCIFGLYFAFKKCLLSESEIDLTEVNLTEFLICTIQIHRVSAFE